jgi:hypothetical protein
MDCKADMYGALPLDSDLLQPAFYPQGESARAKNSRPDCIFCGMEQAGNGPLGVGVSMR